MNKKNLVVVQPPNHVESKLMMENTNLLKRMNESKIGVDDKLPFTVNKIDHSVHSSPRCVRLANECKF